jgi:hypothetical protein
MTIHFTSTHPLRQILAAYHFYINRMLSLLFTNHAKLHEWNVICNITHNNGFPSQLIHNLRRKLTNKRTAQTVNSTANTTTWATFSFHNPLVHKVTNLFKNTNVKPLPLLFKALLHGQRDCVFFSGQLNVWNSKSALERLGRHGTFKSQALWSVRDGKGLI